MSADAQSADDKAAVAAGIRELVDWAAGCRITDIPEPVLKRAAGVLVDDLAAMIGARDEPEVARFHAGVIERARHAEATVLRGGHARVGRIDAAVANAVAADWLELDEGYRRTPCHAGLYVLPASLATAEADNLRCDEFLRAIALGYEVVTRVARGWRQRALNMQSHGRYSAIGAAAATALLQKVDSEMMFRAVTAAATLTNPSPRGHLVAGALVRNIWPAQGAWSGMMAVEWARCGIGGSPDAFFDVYTDVLGGTPEPAALTEGLGTSWALLDGYTKIYACCQHLHSTVEALLDLRPALLGTAPLEEIESVEIATHALARPLMNPRPETTLGAKFSMPHAVAAALAIGSGGAEAFAFDTLRRPDIERLRQRVRVKPYSPDLPPPNDRPARADIRLRDGRVLTAECLSARGGSDRPLPPETVTEKLEALAAPAYPAIGAVLAPLQRLDPAMLGQGWRQVVDAFSSPAS
jgi:2-methylcitrate dehydratase PrpD